MRDSCRGSAAVLVAAMAIGGLLTFPGGAAAVTVTVGPQSLDPLTSFFACFSPQNGYCVQTALPTRLQTPGDRTTVPADGMITAWRVKGSCAGNSGLCAWRLRVLEPDQGVSWGFIASGSQVDEFSPCSLCSPVNGTAIAMDPPLTVDAGEYLGVEHSGYNGAEAEVMSRRVSPFNSETNVFVCACGDGDGKSPDEVVEDEPMFNATVQLDQPVVTGLGQNSGSTAGGQTVTITGDHLTSASQVHFGSDTPATNVVAPSNNKVTATAPEHDAGTVDVTVTTLGGTSTPTTAGRYTFVAPATSGTTTTTTTSMTSPFPPAKASFAGSKSSIGTDRRGRLRFSFHATPALTGTTTFKSVKKVRVSRNNNRENRVTLARKSFSVPASGEVRLEIRLSNKNLRILKLNRKIRTRVSVILKNAAGLTSTASTWISLKAPNPRHS